MPVQPGCCVLVETACRLHTHRLEASVDRAVGGGHYLVAQLAVTLPGARSRWAVHQPAATPAAEVQNAHVSKEPSASGPLSDAERDTFVDLLRRVCEYELDQWEHWRYRTSYGNVYIDISRKLPEGHPEAAYDEIPRRDL
jgi:hypothetical protein